MVSTFGGGDASFGGLGWEGFRDGMREEDLDVSSVHLLKCCFERTLMAASIGGGME